MNVSGLLPQLVTVKTVTAGADDDFGNPTTSITSRTVNGRLDQQASTEQVDGREVVVTRTILYLEPDDPITSADKVAVDGRDYEVAGAPNVVYGATSPHHLEVLLRATEA